MTCSIDNQKKMWNDQVKRVMKQNPKASKEAVEDAVMRDIIGPMTIEQMSEKSNKVFGYHMASSGGKIQVKYSGGRKTDIRRILSVQDKKSTGTNGKVNGTAYTLVLDNGEQYTFENGESRSKRTAQGRHVTIGVMDNIESRVKSNSNEIETALNEMEAVNAFGSNGKGIKQGASHEEIKDELWKDPDKMMELFDLITENEEDSLSGSEKKHTKELRELLETMTESTTPIFNEFKVFIDKQAKKNQGMAIVNKKDSKIVLEMRDGSSAITEDMSGVETYMHELIHMSVEMARQYKKGAISREIAELNKLYTKARDSITVEDLIVNGNKKAAQKQWNQMFKNGDKGISEFIALGMTNAKVKEALKAVEAKDMKHERKTDTLFGYISHAVIRLYEIIRDMVTANRGLDGDERLRWIVDKMWQHNDLSGKKASIDGKIAEYAAKARQRLDKTLVDIVVASASVVGKSVDWMIEQNKNNFLGQTLETGRNLASLFNPFMSEARKTERNRALASLSEFMDGENNWLGMGWLLAPEGTLMWLANYFADDDAETEKLEKFGLMNQQLDRHRQRKIEAYGGEAKKAIGDATKQQQIALTRVLLETDAQSLLSSYTVDEVKMMLADDSMVEQLIEDERARLDGMIDSEEVLNYIKSQTMGLGHAMATGVTGSSVQHNAYDILLMKSVDRKPSRPFTYGNRNNFRQILETTDRLATLEAIKRSDKNDKRLASEVETGLDVIMAMHKEYMRKAIEFAKKNKTGVYPSKGEMKDLKEDTMSSKMASGDAKTEAHMKKLGYKKVGDAGVDGLAMYTSRVRGVLSFNKQAMAKINESKRLHTVSTIKGRGQDEIAAEVTAIKIGAESDIALQMKEIRMPKMDGYIKLGSGEKVKTYGISVDKKLYADKMMQDNKAPIMLGKMMAEISEKEEAIELNDKVYSSILDDMRKYERGDPLYIEIGPDSKQRGQTATEYSKELWSNLPYNVKKRIMTRRPGKQYVAIRRDIVDMYVGGRAPSALNMRIPYTGKTVNSLLRTTEIGGAISNMIKMGGEIWDEVVGMQKVDIVIKTPKVVLDNIRSNVNYSVALGQMPWTTIDKQARMFIDTKKYLDNEQEIDGLEVRLKLKLDSKSDRNAMRRRLKDLKRENSSMMIDDLMKAGLFTSVMEDVEDNDLKASSKIKRFLEDSELVKAIQKQTPDVVQDGLATMYMTEDTPLFKAMLMTVQYSDFVARAARYQFLVEEQGLSKKVAMKMILDEFVNYNRMLPKVLRWMNAVGDLWFIQYFLGANKSLINKAKTRISAVVGMSFLTDMTNPTEAAIPFKDYGYMIKNPWEVAYEGTSNNIVPMSTLEMVGLWDK